MDDSLRGRLLVATPILRDENFDETVVLVVDHDDGGAIGLVLNRPSRTPVAAALPGWDGLAGKPEVVFVGGPVGEQTAFCLGASDAPDERWAKVVSDVHLVEPDGDPALLGVVLRDARVYAGYAGWNPGQLEAEISEGAWLVVDASAGDVFDPDPTTLWHRVVRRQPGLTATMAHYPADPSLN